MVFFHCPDSFSLNSFIWSSILHVLPLKDLKSTTNAERTKTLLVSIWKTKSKLTKKSHLAGHLKALENVSSEAKLN